MKILIITAIFPPEIGGPATYANELLIKLPNIKVVSFGNQKYTSQTHFIPTAGGLLKRQLSFFIDCLKLGFDCDIFYLLEPAVVGLSAFLAAKVLGKKLIVKYVGDPAWEDLRRNYNATTLPEFLSSINSKLNWLYWVTRIVLSNSDKIVVPAKHLSEILTKHYKVDSVVIPNSVDIQNPNIVKKNKIIFVGRLVNWKNIDLVLKAAQILSKRKVKFRLEIVGNGPEEKKLKFLSKKLKLGSAVNFAGVLDFKATMKKISESKILVLFSDYEGLAHVAIEAQSLGTVVVASAIPGNDEINSTVLVPAKDYIKLAESIEKVLTNKSLWNKLSKRGLENVKTNFNWQTNIAKLSQIFQGVIES